MVHSREYGKVLKIKKILGGFLYEKFKRIQAFLLAAVMAVMTFGTTTAFAAEPSAVATIITDVAPADLGYQTIVHQTFNMSGSHTGSARSYSGYNPISFICLFRNQNGTNITNGTILAVRLYDATTGAKVYEWQGSNGHVMSESIYIDQSHRYYFQYVVAYGTPNLTIEMHIGGYES